MASSRGSLLNFSRVADYAARVPADEKKLAELTAELAFKNEQQAEALERVAERERAQMKLEQELRAANEQFDEKIQERTSELIRSNELLQREIQRRVQTEEMLRKLSARIL